MNTIELLYIDLFCGAGGTSSGVEYATVDGRKCAEVIACVNHDANAIKSHAANHPKTMHFTEDIRTLDLAPLVRHLQKMKRKHPTAKVVLWASLECTNFSKAKGGQRTMIRKARELGLQKDEAWLRQVWEERRRVAHVVSRKKGYPGGFVKGVRNSPDTEFKKGHTASPEVKQKQSEGMRRWYRQNPRKAVEKALKAWETRRRASITKVEREYTVKPDTLSGT